MNVHVDLVAAGLAAGAARHVVQADDACGAVVGFDGITRSETASGGDALIALEYEALHDMALSEMRRLGEEAVRAFGVRAVALMHRVGIVPVGGVSVSVAAAGGHRAEAFDACRFLIDALKRDVPIWKRDVFESGKTQWSGQRPDDAERRIG